MAALDWSLAALVFLGALPLLAGLYQCGLALVEAAHPRHVAAEGTLPRVAVVIPAWNEGAVLGPALERLMLLDYPSDRLRVYVVDDASTDATPTVATDKAACYPGRVFHLRRERGGEGKAHTINHALRIIRAEDWYEAVLITDADVIFTPRSVRLLAEHLSDERVGAVGAYIKEGSRPANSLNRFIGFEYVTAQAGARRAQNVLGAQACLPGGAELISRPALESVGGEVDTTTLAEDTVTTFGVQLAGRRVVFEPRAVAWAEEPRDIAGLWKQRVRWARGNVQVTLRFRHVWLRRRRAGRLGGISFALIWFSVALMPVLMLLASTGLISLYEINEGFARHVFRSLWAFNGISYLIITSCAYVLDRGTARRAWFQGAMFPGVVSLVIVLYAVAPGLVEGDGAHALRDIGITPTHQLGTVLVLFSYAWLSVSMLAAYSVKALEKAGLPGRLVGLLVYLVGYGPLLCAITASAYVKELRGADRQWEKTEKVGAMGNLT